MRGRRPHPGRSLLAALALVAALAVPNGPGHAHFLLNIDTRLIEVEHAPEGLRLYMRIPTPVVILNAFRRDADARRYPFTIEVTEEGRPMFYTDVEAMRRDPEGLGRLVADTQIIEIDGEPVTPRIEGIRLYPLPFAPPFRTLEEARRATVGPVVPRAVRPTYVGNTVIDLALFYPASGPVESFEFRNNVDAAIAGRFPVVTVITARFAGNPFIFRMHDLTPGAVTVGLATAWRSFAAFIVEGARHILGGYDHLLFVLVLTVGAPGFTPLLWRVTGFTAGHSVTLATGFFGLVPGAGWFIPAVEAAIAASIVYAGAAVLLRRPGAAGFAVAGAIGLVHGLGFSVVLGRILQLDSQNLVASLVAFNLGVEVGQVLIVACVWPALWLLGRRYRLVERWGATAVAAPCVAVAAVWTAERASTLVALAS